MSSESFGAFLVKIENDAALRQELRAAGFDAGMEVEGLIAFAARKGYSLTIDDPGELADDQLDKVAGGGGDDLSDENSLALQRYMDTRSRFMSTLSNIMKKQSDTASSIVSNLK